MAIRKPTVKGVRRALPYVLVIVISLAIGAFLFSPHTPAQLSDATTGGTAPVTMQELGDARTVELDVSTAPAQPIRFVGTGTLTSLSCPDDNAIQSGVAVMQVDGVNVVPLATSTPLWRELTLGESGEDVRALQTELRRLGYNVSADGVVGAGTLRATARLLGLKGSAASTYDTISPSSFLWIPSPRVPVSGCALTVGARLDETTEVFTSAATIASAHIKKIPSEALPGKRILLVDGTQIPVDDEGAIIGEDALAALATSDTYMAWAEKKEGALRARYVLAEPAQVYVIAPATVYNVRGNQGCVQDKGVPRKIEIVSSELGKTLVMFPDGKAAPTQLDVNPDVSKPCS